MIDHSWGEIVSKFLRLSDRDGPIHSFIAQFKQTHPLDVTIALESDLAERGKADATDFLAFVIRYVVEDHVIADAELAEVRHVARLLRVQEGDLLLAQRREVGQLLSLELERLLEDETIDVNEALHKVKLQELFGLSYDQFLDLTAPTIEQIIIRLLRRFDVAQAARPSTATVEWFHRCLVALDTVYDLNPHRVDVHDRSGYLYLLVNPSMPGLVKVGRTGKVPKQRAAELTGATGVPTPFVLLYELRVQDAVAAERYVHAKLEALGHRLSSSREFFTAPASEVAELMREARTAVASAGLTSA